MPIVRCNKNGKSGWKYQNTNTCYVGPGAKKKAIKQGVAIELSRKRQFEGSAHFDSIYAEQDFIDALIVALSGVCKTEDDADKYLDNPNTHLYDSKGIHVAGANSVEAGPALALLCTTDKLTNVEWPINDA
jgi:hypothetical protein